jgi:hypothetical protein
MIAAQMILVQVIEDAGTDDTNNSAALWLLRKTRCEFRAPGFPEVPRCTANVWINVQYSPVL